jgi:hypothetical protein
MVISRGNGIKKAGRSQRNKYDWTALFRNFSDISLMPFHFCHSMRQKTRKIFLFHKAFMTIHLPFLCFRRSINQDNMTFPGNNFTNSFRQYENCDLYTQQVIKSTCIRFHYHLWIWRSRLWKSDNYNLYFSKLHSNTLPNIQTNQ